MMNRRLFIFSALSSLLFSEPLLAKVKSGRELSVYIDESGNIGDSEPFVIGALMLDASYDIRRLESIRVKSNFKPVLKYSCSNKYKKLLASPFISEFFENELMSFSALVIPSTLNQQWPENKKNRTSLYHHNYAEFIKNNNKRLNNLSIYLEKRTTTGQDEYLKKFIEENNSGTTVKFISERQSNCIQLSDLLTGCIFGELTKVEDKVKLSIITDIKNHLKTVSLTEQIDFKQGKYITRIASQI